MAKTVLLNGTGAWTKKGLRFLFTTVLALLAIIFMSGASLNTLSQGETQTLKEVSVAWQNQEHEKALEVFTELLENETSAQTPKALTTKLSCYQDYLDAQKEKTHDAYQRLIETYKAQADRNPQDLDLNYIVAATDANLGNYPEFFTRFYLCFKKDRDHYLANKARALLVLKLSDFSKNPERKTQLRARAYSLLKRGLEKNPYDMMLCRYLLALSIANRNPQDSQRWLQTILNNNLEFEKSELLPWVSIAIEANNLPLASALISKAQARFGYSRLVEQAKSMIAAH